MKKELISPITGGVLEPTAKEGVFYDPYTKQNFVMTEHGVLPTFIPDDTGEPAHVEGDYLVGNSSGRKFPIGDNGKIKIPYDPITISPDASTEEMAEYFKARKDKQLNMSQEEIDARIEALEKEDAEIIEQHKQQVFEKMTKDMSPEIKAETIFLLRMKEQVKKDPSKITQQDVAKLASIMINNPHQGQNNTPAKQSR